MECSQASYTTLLACLYRPEMPQVKIVSDNFRQAALDDTASNYHSGVTMIDKHSKALLTDVTATDPNTCSGGILLMMLQSCLP